MARWNLKHLFKPTIGGVCQCVAQFRRLAWSFAAAHSVLAYVVNDDDSRHHSGITTICSREIEEIECVVIQTGTASRKVGAALRVRWRFCWSSTTEAIGEERRKGDWVLLVQFGSDMIGTFCRRHSRRRGVAGRVHLEGCFEISGSGGRRNCDTLWNPRSVRHSSGVALPLRLGTAGNRSPRAEPSAHSNR